MDETIVMIRVVELVSNIICIGMIGGGVIWIIKLMIGSE